MLLGKFHTNLTKPVLACTQVYITSFLVALMTFKYNVNNRKFERSWRLNSGSSRLLPFFFCFPVCDFCFSGNKTSSGQINAGLSPNNISFSSSDILILLQCTFGTEHQPSDCNFCFLNPWINFQLELTVRHTGWNDKSFKSQSLPSGKQSEHY